MDPEQPQAMFMLTEQELQQLDILSQKFDSRALFFLLHAARSRPAGPQTHTELEALRKAAAEAAEKLKQPPNNREGTA